MSISKKQNHHNTGFMLIEVLIAVSILSVGLVILISSLTQSLQTNSAIYKENIAVLLAQSELAKIQDKLYPYGVSRGDFEGEYPDFYWELEATQIDNFLDKIKISIIWDEKKQGKKFSIYTYLARRER